MWTGGVAPLMLRFLGHTLELAVDVVFYVDHHPSLSLGHDEDSHPWVILQLDRDPGNLSWACGQISGHAAQLILDGKACAWDAIRHSLGGTVEVVTIHRGQTVPDRCLLSSEVCIPVNRVDIGPNLVGDIEHKYDVRPARPSHQRSR
jgi:hypothetical protein